MNKWQTIANNYAIKKEAHMKNYRDVFFDYNDLWPIRADRNRHYENQEVAFLVNSTHWIFYDKKK